MAPDALLKAPAAALRLAGRAAALPFRLAAVPFKISMQKRTWLLFYTGYFAALLAKAARKAWRARADAYEGLDGLVSFSSRLIAAARAAESEREDRFIYDPLASVLAGRKALARHGLRPRNVLLLARSAPEAPAAPPGWSRRDTGELTRAAAAVCAAFVPPDRPVPRLVMRTRFFDDAVLAAAWGGGRPAPDALLATAGAVEALADAGHGPCQQVVMLGAGMDTRAWRLPLPQGVSWFEVDRADVLAAKVATLSSSGVQLRGRGQYSSNQLDLASLMPHTFNLTAARWSSAACDLQAVGWTSQLELQGLDLLQPTCWVAEGLLYYLNPAAVSPMLKEAAAASAPGSVLIANLLTESGLSNLRRRAAERAAAEAAAAGAPAGGGAAGGGGGGGGQQQQQQQRGAVVGGGAPKGMVGSGLTDHFAWGCPDNVEQFLAGAGWTVVQRQSWRAMAQAYGWAAEPSRLSEPPPAPAAAAALPAGAAGRAASAGGPAPPRAAGPTLPARATTCGIASAAGAVGGGGAGEAGGMAPEQEVQFLVAVRTF
ncbi:MAG: S-adenosyl-L-methionine-dependent methyltransferase [Monoraphidium minutum]|nr:MAG: S-adenosyl-L-methionine-dependent methyltransferase [Monoraphidium minutum]